MQSLLGDMEIERAAVEGGCSLIGSVDADSMLLHVMLWPQGRVCWCMLRFRTNILRESKKIYNLYYMVYSKGREEEF